MKHKHYTYKDIKYFCNYNKNPFHNIKEYKLYLSRKKFLLENGYAQSAIWDTDYWFLEVITDLLERHLKWNREFLDMNNKSNKLLNIDIQKMLSILCVIKEKLNNHEDDSEELKTFFDLFSKNFHRLWN